MLSIKYPLNLLYECLPKWGRVLSVAENGEAFNIQANPPRSGGLSGISFALTVKNDDGKIVVLETILGTILPAACPERHINRNGTFCIGLDVGKQIISPGAAEQWWGFLAEFLDSQQSAAKYRRWPPRSWLSHGAAAKDHLAMEEIAQKLGWEEEVRIAIEHKKGWLSGILPRHRKNSEMLVNQRLPCPRGCFKRKGKRSLKILRKDCSYKHQVSLLVKHENSRRKQEESFVQEFLSNGFVCCGRMDECPFRIQK